MIRTFSHLIAAFVIGLALIVPAHIVPAQAAEQEQVKALYESKIKAWLDDPVVIEAIKAQNAAHADLTQEEIDNLDQQWRDGNPAVTHPVLYSDLSKYLQGVVSEAGGMYSEVFVMDNKGLNIGQSAETSDYWQGDEAKFQETFGKGAGAMHVSEVEFDESSQTYQLQLSVTISDAGTPIGAATIGLDADSLE